MTHRTWTQERTQDGHVARLTIRCGSKGWESQEERDHTTVRVVRLTDWHRVERLSRLFEREQAVRTPN